MNQIRKTPPYNQIQLNLNMTRNNDIETSLKPQLMTL